MNSFFRALMAILLAASLTAALAQAPAASTAAGKGADKSADAHRKEDIARHRQMARAHEQAAQCLERGEKESACQEQLRAACQGIAVGRYCGMRHGH
jgi:Ni/Co efflux regulator RcnB